MKLTGPFGRRLVAAIVAAAVIAIGGAASAEPVAMVTDLEGGNSVSGMGGRTELSLLAELEAGGRIDLAGGARLVIVYYESGNEYEFSGPASIGVGAQGPTTISGAGPERRQLQFAAAGGGVVIRPAGVAQASLVMRGANPDSKLRLDNLVDTKTLDRRPVFRWRPVAGAATYRFELTDDAGATLVETDIETVRLPLAEGVTLEPDVTYTWEVTAYTGDGTAHSNWGDFYLATEDERALVERMRPEADAPFSRRVVFAAILEQMELRDEARKYWKALLAERGDDPQLRRLAGE